MDANNLQSRAKKAIPPENAPPFAKKISGSFSTIDLQFPDDSGSWHDQFASSIRESLAQEMTTVTFSSSPGAIITRPSGSGVTASSCMDTTRRDLYRVDLGQLVTKYVGETEKNLTALFDAAAKLDCILLFDEADSLFGERSEVDNEAKQKAHLDFSQLLPHLRRHTGPCVFIASDHENLIDTLPTNSDTKIP